MTHRNFPFGKYAGTPMNELDSTYIVHALETFDLSSELEADLMLVLDIRFGFVRNNIHVTNLIILNDNWNNRNSSVTKLDYNQAIWYLNRYINGKRLLLDALKLLMGDLERELNRIYYLSPKYTKQDKNIKVNTETLMRRKVL